MKMKLLFLLFAVLAAFCAAEEEAVITLTESNFDEVVNAADLILVEFYAPWCGHCKNLAPAYEKAAQTLQKHDPPIPLAKVDATEHEALGSRFGVTGYPTLKVFRKGKPTEYKGPRDAPGIVRYMDKQSGSASKKLTTVEEVDKFINNKNEDVVLVAFFDSETGLLSTFRSLADKLREEFQFAEVLTPSVSEHFKHKNKVVAFKKFDEKVVEYDGANNLAELEKFLQKHSIAVAGELTANNRKRYHERGLPLVTVYFTVDHDKNVKRTNYYLRRLEKVAADYKDKVLFAIADKELLEAEAFGVTGDEKEVVGLQDPVKQLNYKYPYDIFNVENVKQFVDDYLAGKIKAHIKSEPVPETNDGPVKVAVGENFHQLVFENDKDVFIEFYAPWCGHCKSLAPKWDELGKRVKGVESLVIAKIDATANDYPRDKFAVNGFPSIFLKTAKGAIKKYDGSRETKDFISWLEKNVSHKFELKEEKKKDKKSKKQKEEL